MKEADTDGDGHLSRAEFVAVLAAMRSSPGTHPAELGPSGGRGCARKTAPRGTVCAGVWPCV